MTTITFKINERTKAGRAFLEITNLLVNDSKAIEIIEINSKKIKVEDSSYNPKFVKMILKAHKSSHRTEINPNDIWGSLGLK
jgi:hypothetical protein